SGSSAMEATITLSATSRSRMVSWARYTIPIAPLPSGLMISYLPMRPESSFSGADGASGFDSGSLMTRGEAPSEALELEDKRAAESTRAEGEAPPRRARATAGRRALLRSALPRHREMVAAVARPAVLGGLLAQRHLL